MSAETAEGKALVEAQRWKWREYYWARKAKGWRRPWKAPPPSAAKQAVKEIRRQRRERSRA